MTTQCNNMLRFGSDKGMNMAAVYHTVISTVKIHGRSVREHLGYFFKDIFNGCRDYINLTPPKHRFDISYPLINRLNFNYIRSMALKSASK